MKVKECLRYGIRVGIMSAALSLSLLSPPTVAAGQPSVLGVNPVGLDTAGNIPDLAFNINGQQILDMNHNGLGVNIGPGAADPGPSQALDVNGYVRIRPVNQWGGAMRISAANNNQLWLSNLVGMFALINNDWKTQLFAVDQNGNAATLRNIYSPGEVAAQEIVRMIGGNYGTVLTNSNGAFSLQLTPAGYPYSTSNYTLMTVSGVTDMASFAKTISITGGGLYFADGTLQTTAGVYGGSYSYVTASDSTRTCTANYKTMACSCPATAPHAVPTMAFALPDGSGLSAYSCIASATKLANGYVWTQTAVTPLHLPGWTTSVTAADGTTTNYIYYPSTGKLTQSTS